MAGFRIHNNKAKMLAIYGRNSKDISGLKEKKTDGVPLPEYSSAGKVQEGEDRREPEIERYIRQHQQDSTDLSSSQDAEKPHGLVKVTILHTNDIHGNILPRKVKDEEGRQVETGGEAVLASVIEDERQKAAQNGENVILVDSGDIAMGTAISGVFQGKPMIEIMNREGYDAATIGNHDLDWGIAPLQNMIEQAKFPFVASNLLGSDGKQLPKIRPFIIKELPGVKVGIVGIANPQTNHITSKDEVKDLKFIDPIESLNQTIPVMKEQGADIIIVLSHAGLENDKKIASNVKGIDLIVGGHSHHTLQKPIQVGKTLIVQTGYGGRNLGKVQLEWEPDKKQTISGNATLIPIVKNRINPDREVSLIIKKYQEKVDAIMGVKLGEAAEDLQHPVDGRESNLGNTIADVMRNRTGADFAIINSGSIRSDLRRGEIRYRDIYSVIPFDSKIVTLEMSGEDLLDILEAAAGRSRDESLQVSGLKVKYDSSRPIGQRLVSVEDEDGNKINPEKNYTVATIDYLSRGGDHYDRFTNCKTINEDLGVLQEEMAEQVKVDHTLRPSSLGRMVDLSSL